MAASAARSPGLLADFVAVGSGQFPESIEEGAFQPGVDRPIHGHSLKAAQVLKILFAGVLWPLVASVIPAATAETLGIEPPRCVFVDRGFEIVEVHRVLVDEQWTGTREIGVRRPDLPQLRPQLARSEAVAVGEVVVLELLPPARRLRVPRHDAGAGEKTTALNRCLLDNID